MSLRFVSYQLKRIHWLRPKSRAIILLPRLGCGGATSATFAAAWIWYRTMYLRRSCTLTHLPDYQQRQLYLKKFSVFEILSNRSKSCEIGTTHYDVSLRLHRLRRLLRVLHVSCNNRRRSVVCNAIRASVSRSINSAKSTYYRTCVFPGFIQK